MDQTQKPTTDQIAENTDLSKQYQDILNQYSKELQEDAPKDTGQVLAPPQESNPPFTPTSSIEIPTSTPAQTSVSTTTLPPVSPEPSPAPPTPVVPTALPPVPPMVDATSLTTSNSGSTGTPQPKNIFKYFFFVSLLIFLGVFGMIMYTVVSSTSQPQSSTVSSSSTPTPSADSSTQKKFCEVNDKKIAQGETFASMDGCNTCTCGEDLMISCTEKECPASHSATSTNK